jgi:hypothetical protein
MYFLCGIVMDNVERKEVKKFLQWHEEIIQANNSAFLHISSKMTELEHANTTNVANIMNLLLQQKHMIDALEAKCQHLGAQVLPQ